MYFELRMRSSSCCAFLAGLISKCLHSRLTNLEMFCLVAQRGGLQTVLLVVIRTIASYSCLLFIHRFGKQGWCIQSPEFGDYGILRFILFGTPRLST